MNQRPEVTVIDWASVLRHLPPRDLAYLALGGGLSGPLRYAWRRARGEPLDPSTLPERDPEFCALVGAVLRVVAERYFRWKVHGVEHVPATGGAMLVGSHNGGLLNTDAYLTHLAVYDHHGFHRGIRALAHDFNFYDPVMGRLTAKAGAVPASADAARAALRAGELVLVYPGSDRDTFRPFAARGRIELAGRRGFLRIAIRESVPIVPVVSAGTHEQLVILTRGDRIASWLGMRRWLRTDVFPIAFTIPFGLGSAFVPYVPLPAQTTIAFGPAIRFDDCSPGDADDPAVLARCYARVETQMQTLMDSVMRDRVPFLGVPTATR